MVNQLMKHDCPGEGLDGGSGIGSWAFSGCLWKEADRGWEQGCREFTAGLSYDMWLLWRNYSSLTLALMSSSLLGGQDGLGVSRPPFLAI